MCKHPIHLSENDRRFLKSLRIARWLCPKCEEERKDDAA